MDPGDPTKASIKRPKIDEQFMADQTDNLIDHVDQEIDNSSGIDPANDFPYTDLVLQCQGAEARLYRATFLGKPVMVKERFAKAYRHPTLDEQLRREHLRQEIRCMSKCRSAGIDVPPLYFLDPMKNRLVLGYIENAITIREYISRLHSDHGNSEEFERSLLPLADEIGRIIAVLHSNNVIHGDLTTSNILIKFTSDLEHNGKPRLILIDFGLSYIEHLAEDKGVDLYVLEKAFLSTHPNTEAIFERILKSYGNYYKSGGGGRKALVKLDEVRLRGRKREMIG